MNLALILKTSLHHVCRGDSRGLRDQASDQLHASDDHKRPWEAYSLVPVTMMCVAHVGMLVLKLLVLMFMGMPIRPIVWLSPLRIGRMGIKKCTAVNDVWLTVYDAAENGKGFGDEQLSFGPVELLAFCREVLRIANNSMRVSE